MKLKRILFVLCSLAVGTAAGAQPLPGAAKMWTKSVSKTVAQQAQKGPRTPLEMARQVVARQKQVYADKKLLNEAIDKSLDGFGLDKAI